MSRILFIGLPFYTYTDRIVDSLRQKGHDVTYYPNENRSFAAKVFRAVAPRIYQRIREAYHDRIVRETESQAYDYVFFLQSHRFSHQNMARMRANHPEARFVLYNWDSLRTHDYSSHLQYFDWAKTFDRADAKKLGIGYLPLFALPEYFAVDPDAPKSFDLYFVATIGQVGRLVLVKALRDHCRANAIRLSFNLFCSPRVYWQALRKGLSIEGLRLSAMTQQEIIAILQSSKAVFDHPNHAQSGYTMRFIENMCAGRKIVTTNPLVEQEAFYTPDRFHVVKDGNFTGIREFLDRPLTSATSFADFALDNWTDQLLKP
jgi:hypothetical protein